MFDLITGHARHIPGGGTGPVLASSALHLLALGAIVTVPLLLMREVLPDVPTMMAFVANAPAPAPPPPPPAAPAPIKSAARTTAAPSASPVQAPVEAPSEVAPEPVVEQPALGVPGGVEGGVPDGVVGGIVGGIVDDAVPPPPPPPPVQRGPVRVGGQIKQPTLVSRVEPIYPGVAAAAHIEGVVILEATVSAEGRVRDVKVLRSAPLLDKAAVDAVLQWRYSPVLLNGTPVPFVLTVVVSFSVPPTGAAARY